MKQQFLAYIAVILAIISSHNYATQLVLGPATSTTSNVTFNSYVAQKVYSPGSATLYVGLEAADATSNKSIYAVKRPIGTATPTFIDIAGTAGIPNLTLATNLGNAMPYLGYNQIDSETILDASNYNGTKTGQTTTLKDATGDDTESIFTLAGMLLPDSANKGYFFAAVSPSTTTSFGQPDSGIALIGMVDSSDASNLNLNQTAAEALTPTAIAAKKLDPSVSQVRINEDPTIEKFATMHWDGKLQRLYTGLELTTSAGTGNGAKAVVVAQVSCPGILTLHDIVPNPAIAPGELGAIVAYTNSTDSSESISILHIKTMHCSTGPSYLIVNGDVGPLDEVNNTIYALPLVEVCPESAIQGTLAKANASLSYKQTFTIPAIVPADLALNNTPPVQVGAGPLPIQATTIIFDIEVVGDTVYVSIATGQTPTDDNGIFYSQALFDKTGKIARWTPWTKRAFPFNAFYETSAINNGIRFFTVDAVTGKVWAIDGQTGQVVRVTTWDKGASCTRDSNNVPIYNSCGQSRSGCCSCSECNPTIITNPVCCNLPAQVCASLPCGCYSVLDLDQSTRGFTTEFDDPVTLDRFTLFGGCGKVDIAHVSTAFYATITSPQTVTEDFCTSCSIHNFLETLLPNRNVCVNIIEYSRPNSDNPNQCYFFAGTDNGLYTYATRNGTGFALDELNIDTLSTGAWSKIANFSDPIIDIKTTGLSLYIVTRSVKHGSMNSSVYRVDFEDTVDQMFSTSYLLAQSGITPFENCPAFTAIQPVTVKVLGIPETIQAEQLVLATNYGLFGSNADSSLPEKGIASATDQAAAAWQTVPNKNKSWFEGIAGIDTPIPSTVWPISVEDLCGARSFQHSWIFQLSSVATNTEPFFGTFEPTFFNAIVRTSAFENIDPITYFWSDGARRFFIINRPQDPEIYNKLMSFPFNTLEWRVYAPGQQILLFDPYVAATKRFHWVKQIGITGILMAGTNDGVIALE